MWAIFELIIGLIERPKTVLLMFVIVTPVFFLVLWLKEPAESQTQRDAIQQQEPEPERRITKIVRWLWEKD